MIAIRADHRGYKFKEEVTKYLATSSIKPIADTPNRLYVDWLAWIILYLFPYIANMAHNNVVITEIWFFPNTIIYLLFAKYYSGILSQQQ